MKHTIVTFALTVIYLSACGESAPTGAAPNATTSKASDLAPPPKRMNFLVGRSLIVKRAVPSQMTGACDTTPKIRKNKPPCQKQIGAMAKMADFKVKSCIERGKRLRCKGIVRTKIGSANVVATFTKENENWQGKIDEIVAGTWKKKP